MTVLAQSTDPSAPVLDLAQYGAIGVFLVVTILAIRVLFKVALDALDKERLRADRWENRYTDLSEQVRDRHAVILDQATKSIEDATRRLHYPPDR